MPQLIQFEQQVVHRTEVEVSGLGGALHVIGRALNGTKVVNFVGGRYHHHPAGMLSRGTFYPFTACGETSHLGLGEHQSPLFFVFLYITKSGFFGNTRNSACLKHVFTTEQGFGIFMNFGLDFPCKVQVNIGNFIPLKPKEGFKRNIVTVTVHGLTAFGAILGGQVKARADGTVFNKLAMFTVGANVVRRQGVYL